MIEIYFLIIPEIWIYKSIFLITILCILYSIEKKLALYDFNKLKRRILKCADNLGFEIKIFVHAPLPNKPGFSYNHQRSITESMRAVFYSSYKILWWTLKEFNLFYNNLLIYWEERKIQHDALIHEHKKEPLKSNININDIDYIQQNDNEISDLKEIKKKIQKLNPRLIFYIEEEASNVNNPPKILKRDHFTGPLIEDRLITYKNIRKYKYTFYVIIGHKNKYINKIFKKIFKNKILVRQNILTSIPLDLEFCFKIFNI